jgi:hypothetical protein
MQIAFRCIMTLNAGNRGVHFHHCVPVIHHRVGFQPDVTAVAPEALIYAGVGDAVLIAWKLPQLRYLRRGFLANPRTGIGELNDLCGFDVAHDCTTLSALINASIAAAVAARSW